MTIVITSLTLTNVPYELSVSYVNTTLNFNSPHHVDVAPWMPRFFKIDFGDYEAVDVLVTSSETQRAVIAVQVRAQTCVCVCVCVCVLCVCVCVCAWVWLCVSMCVAHSQHSKSFSTPLKHFLAAHGLFAAINTQRHILTVCT